MFNCKKTKPTSIVQAFKRGLAATTLLAVFACPAAAQGRDLHTVVEKEDVSRVQELLDEGIDPDIPDPGTYHKLTPLHKAARLRNASIMRQLIEAGADVNAPDFESKTPLHHVLTSPLPKPYEDAVRLLFERGADPNVIDRTGWTPLHHAVENKQESAMLQLLEHSANPCIRNGEGRTPLHIAAIAFDVGAVALLMSYGGSDCIHTDDYTDSSPIEYMLIWQNLPDAQKILCYLTKENPFREYDHYFQSTTCPTLIDNYQP